MDNVRSYKESDTGKERIKHVLACGDFHMVIGNEADELADQQSEKWNTDSHKNLEQSIIEQIGSILLRENPVFTYIRKYTAQKPESKHERDGMNGVHKRQAELNAQADPSFAVCPDMNIVVCADCHEPGVRSMIFFCADRTLKDPFIGMKDKVLPSHKTENGTKSQKSNQKPADSVHKSGGRPRKLLIREFLNELHKTPPLISCLEMKISDYQTVLFFFHYIMKFSNVNKNLMFIIKNYKANN